MGFQSARASALVVALAMRFLAHGSCVGWWRGHGSIYFGGACMSPLAYIIKVEHVCVAYQSMNLISWCMLSGGTALLCKENFGAYTLGFGFQ